MAKETVKAVRQAEIKAAQLEKDAIRSKEEILTKAQLDAKEIISSATDASLIKAKKALDEANSKGAELLEASKQKAEKEVQLMKEMLKGKEQEAINLIISEVI